MTINTQANGRMTDADKANDLILALRRFFQEASDSGNENLSLDELHKHMAIDTDLSVLWSFVKYLAARVKTLELRQPGTRVRHPEFGVGMVVSHAASDGLVDIHFDGAGLKRLDVQRESKALWLLGDDDATNTA